MAITNLWHIITKMWQNLHYQDPAPVWLTFTSPPLGSAAMLAYLTLPLLGDNGAGAAALVGTSLVAITVAPFREHFRHQKQDTFHTAIFLRPSWPLSDSIMHRALITFKCCDHNLITYDFKMTPPPPHPSRYSVY